MTLTTKEFGEKYNVPDHVEADRLAMETDRAYFKNRPETNAYVRPMIPGESPESTSHVKVIQLAPGVRVRVGFDLEFVPMDINEFIL